MGNLYDETLKEKDFPVMKFNENFSIDSHRP